MPTPSPSERPKRVAPAVELLARIVELSPQLPLVDLISQLRMEFFEDFGAAQIRQAVSDVLSRDGAPKPYPPQGDSDVLGAMRLEARGRARFVCIEGIWLDRLRPRQTSDDLMSWRDLTSAELDVLRELAEVAGLG